MSSTVSTLKDIGGPPPAPPEVSQEDALNQVDTQLKTQAPTGSSTTKTPPSTIKLQFPSTATDATLDGFKPALTAVSGWKAKPQPPNYTEKSITYDIAKVGSTRKIRNGIQYAQTFITKLKDALVAFQDSLDMIKEGANMTDVDVPPDSNVAGLSTIRKTKKASGPTSGPSAVGGRRTRKARKVRKGRKGTRKN
jgi:hypothetical protein